MVRIALNLLPVALLGVVVYWGYRQYGDRIMNRIDLRPGIQDVTWARDYGWWGYATNRVNYPVPSFSAVSTSGKKFSQYTPGGKFYVYVIDEKLPPACLNQDCGPEAAIVTQQGGQLMGFSDPKIARLFGVYPMVLHTQIKESIILKIFRRLFGSTNEILDVTLTVVAESRGLLRGSYKNATLKELGEVIARSGVLQ